MSIALVQVLLEGDSGASAGLSVDLTGSETVTAGNDILLFAFSDKNVTITAISDNLGNTYEEVVTSASTAETPSLRVHVYRATNITGGTLSLQTVSFSGSSFSRGGFSAEYSGMGAGAIGAGGETNYAFADTTPDGNAVSGDGLHLFAMAFNGDQGTITAPTGYTEVGRRDSGTASTNRAVYVAHKIGTDSGAKSATFQNAVDWVALTSHFTEPITRPALAGISFDGVTVR